MSDIEGVVIDESAAVEAAWKGIEEKVKREVHSQARREGKSAALEEAAKACCAEGKCEGCANCEEDDKELLTPDQARAQVGRSVVKMLRLSIEDLKVGIEVDMKVRPTSNRVANGKKLLAAAMELHNALLAKSKKFDRPLILRPSSRGLKVVR